MPYIKDEQRKHLDFNIENIISDLTSGWVDADNLAGNFNYASSKIISGLLDSEGVNYTILNKLMGALECAKLELYRRMASPYEDKKIQENGDVYFSPE